MNPTTRHASAPLPSAPLRAGRDEVQGNDHQDWLLWQLIDSAFPTGGFAHSIGLEAAWQHGAIRNRTELRDWVQVSLRQIAWSALPLVNAAHSAPARLAELDQLYDAFLSNHVSNRASRVQGRAFWMAACRAFAVDFSAPAAPCHLAPVFGAACSFLELAQATTVRAFVFLHLRSVMAAAVRLNIIGPMEAQATQFQLSPMAETVVQEGLKLQLSDLAQTAPLLDLWQGAHDRLHTRLFQT